jgi:hypothetical protein
MMEKKRTNSGPFMEATTSIVSIHPISCVNMTVSVKISLFLIEKRNLCPGQAKLEAGEHALGRHKWHDTCLAIIISFVSHGITDCW